MTKGRVDGTLESMADEDIARIALAVQAVTNAQIAELGDVSLATIVELVSVVLRNANSIAPAENEAWKAFGKSESVDPHNDMPLTTTQASSRLGMSRPFLIKLLDQGVIPFHHVGRDRRILLSDVNAYLADRSAEKLRFKRAALAHS